MGCLPIIIAFVVVIIPLTAILEWLCRKYSKVERRVKRLEEAMFDGPGGN